MKVADKGKRNGKVEDKEEENSNKTMRRLWKKDPLPSARCLDGSERPFPPNEKEVKRHPEGGNHFVCFTPGTEIYAVDLYTADPVQIGGVHASESEMEESKKKTVFFLHPVKRSFPRGYRLFVGFGRGRRFRQKQGTDRSRIEKYRHLLKNKIAHWRDIG